MMWKGFGSSGARGETTLIAPGAVIDGTITFAGILEIEGRVNGNILAAGDEQAVVRVLQGGHVHGDVSAPLIVVNGTVTGNVHSTDHAELAPRLREVAHHIAAHHRHRAGTGPAQAGRDREGRSRR